MKEGNRMGSHFCRTSFCLWGGGLRLETTCRTSRGWDGGVGKVQIRLFGFIPKSTIPEEGSSIPSHGMAFPDSFFRTSQLPVWAEDGRTLGHLSSF